MSATPKTQPSNVSTADTPERPQNVFTEEPEVAAAKKADQSAPDTKPGQTSDDSDTPPNKSKRKPHRDRPAERRISKLTRQLDASNSENADLKGRIEALENAAPAPKVKPEPKLQDFKTPREYADAVAAWVVESKPASKPKTKPAKPTANTQHAEDLKKFAADGNERIGEKFQAAFTDKTLAINQVMGEFLFDSDLGPEIMVHLHEHQDLARQIWFDSNEEATKRLEALETELEGDPPPSDEIADDGKPAEQQRGADGKFVKDDKKPESEPKPKTGTKSSAPPAPSDSDKGEIIPDANLETADMDKYADSRRKTYRSQGYRM